jgi:hypothetical protein
VLKAIPRAWYSRSYTVLEESQPVADIDLSWWRKSGVLTVQGETYKMYRKGLMSGAFVLQSGGAVLAHAEKPSPLRQSFNVELDGKTYVLRSLYRRDFYLLEGSEKIGSIRPEDSSRRVLVDLPEGMPLPVKAFLIWLVLILWKRQSSD